MGILQERRKNKAICGSCQSPNYIMVPPEEPWMKPGFKCQKCGNFWTKGTNGGIYGELANEEVMKEILRRNKK